jgi:chromosome segregation ATPase
MKLKLENIHRNLAITKYLLVKLKERMKERLKEFKKTNVAISIVKVYVDKKEKQVEESSTKLQEIQKEKEGVNAFLNRLDYEFKKVQATLENCTEKEVRSAVRLVWNVMNEMNYQMMFGIAPEGIIAQKRAAYHLLQEYMIDEEETNNCVEDDTSNMAAYSFVEVIDLVDVDNASISSSRNAAKRKHMG